MSNSFNCVAKFSLNAELCLNSLYFLGGGKNYIKRKVSSYLSYI